MDIPAAGRRGSLDEMRNRAMTSLSPYIRQHANTPVKWQMLDKEAMMRARSENKPIFLHIGFLACHFCHLTTQDSFSNPDVAAVLNNYFIPVIVDREVRADVDAIYQNYCTAINSAAGYPTNVILTPKLEPIFAGSYWPGPGTEHARYAAAMTSASGGGGVGGGGVGGGGSSAGDVHGSLGSDDERPIVDFLDVINRVVTNWLEHEDSCRQAGALSTRQLRSFAVEGTLGGPVAKDYSRPRLPRPADDASSSSSSFLGLSTGPPASPSTASALSGRIADLRARAPRVPGSLFSPLAGQMSEKRAAAGEPNDAIRRPPSAAAAAAAAEVDADKVDLDLDQLEEAVDMLLKKFDVANGGFKGALKFANPQRLSFLLRIAHFPPEVRDVVGDAEDTDRARAMAVYTLRKIRHSGLHDSVGAGFFRFSETADWGKPHWEKMVIDNALLLGVYLDAWLSTSMSSSSNGDGGGGGGGEGPAGSGTGTRASADASQPCLDAEFGDMVVELADYLSSAPIRRPDDLYGGFVSSEASYSLVRHGDPQEREGAYYIWTKREWDSAIIGAAAQQSTSSAPPAPLLNTGRDHKHGGGDDGASADGAASPVSTAALAAAYWNILPHGNVARENDPHDEFVNQNVPHVSPHAVSVPRTFLSPPFTNNNNNNNNTDSSSSSNIGQAAVVVVAAGGRPEEDQVDRLARQFGLTREATALSLAEARRRLRAHRERERARPRIDGKVIAAVNGVVIGALARTAAAMRDADADRSSRYLCAAKQAAAFVRKNLWRPLVHHSDAPAGEMIGSGGGDGGGGGGQGPGLLSSTVPSQLRGRDPILRRFWYSSEPSRTLAFAEDYAYMIDGVLDLYEATGDKTWLDWAIDLQNKYTERFYDPPSAASPSAAAQPDANLSGSGGFYNTQLESHDDGSGGDSGGGGGEAATVLVRIKDGMDTAVPSVNGVSAANLFRLGALVGQRHGEAGRRYARQAKETLNAFETEIKEYHFLYPGMLPSIVAARLGVREFGGRDGDGDGDGEQRERAFFTTPRAEPRVLRVLDGGGGGVGVGVGVGSEPALDRMVELDRVVRGEGAAGGGEKGGRNI